MKFTLYEAPTLETSPDHNTGNSDELFLTSLFAPLNHDEIANTVQKQYFIK